MGLYIEKIANEEEYSSLSNMFSQIMKKDIAVSEIDVFHDNGEGVDRRYNVYKVNAGEGTYILKKSNDMEIEVYKNYLSGKNLPVPEFYGYCKKDRDLWIVIEFIEGEDLRSFTEEMAYLAADSLSKIQNEFWNCSEKKERGNNRFEKYMKRIKRRSLCLKNEYKLAAAYDIFMKRQLECPRTLSNGDFLQCNAIYSKSGITLIDWGFSGVMPYSLDIARLITHGSEEYKPFPFYMTDSYRKIFLKSVYDKLVNKPDYEQFIYDVKMACLNECIEFIEEELKDVSRERDEIFNYYYKCAVYLAEEILKAR